FLRRVYTHASEFGDVAAPATARLEERRARRALERGFEQAKRALTSGLGQPVDDDPDDLFTSHKAPQYAAGLAAYLARSSGGRPAPFDPELRPEPRLDDGLLATLIARAHGGCAVSQLALGTFQAKGEGGVPVDREQAKGWLRRAVEGGLPVAAASLAALLPDGDPEQLRYYRMAAEAGLPLAQFATGFLLAREGPAHDPFEAARWFRRAAEQGNVEGMVRLGALYVEGVGVGLDFAAGADWFTRAAEAGHVGAMRALAKMYGDGIGLKKDPIRARLWTNRADKAGQAAGPAGETR
ncbi:MAG TPA: tetratricopeptide repeat protein, partial [Polyangiaceae bacterium]|nr:tetratricopeptide repeat protein [Polyangiaceae bacterium]